VGQATEHVPEVSRRTAKGGFNSRFGGEHVEGYGIGRAGDLLEEKGGHALSNRSDGDLGDFVDRIDLDGHAMEIAARLEVGEEGAETIEGDGRLRGRGRINYGIE
jgi:hypothetical protein